MHPWALTINRKLTLLFRGLHAFVSSVSRNFLTSQNTREFYKVTCILCPFLNDYSKTLQIFVKSRYRLIDIECALNSCVFQLYC